ncbi:pyruvate dehydrogenase (acetyl-transferring) E1 component subunit alpha [Mycobacterium avium subsp. hominissuis]
MASKSISSEVARRIYSTMLKIYKVDELLRGALKSGRITLFYFPVRGQEAIPATFAAVCEPTDYLVSSYRGMHDEIAKGVPLVPLLAELLGRDGLHRGRGGPMHICDLASGTILTSGIVGSGLPMAVGVGLAAQLEGQRRIVVCSFGDGATNTGAFHEAMNLAAVWQVPVVFVCQNNQFAETTRTDETYRAESLTARAAAYGMPARSVDGYDPVAMYAAMTEAIDRARSGNGPSFLECTCFRYFGHYFGDKMERVPPELLAQEMQKDPVPGFRDRLVAEKLCSEEELAAIDAAVEAEAQAAFNEALSKPMPDASNVLEGLYATAVSHG